MYNLGVIMESKKPRRPIYLPLNLSSLENCEKLQYPASIWLSDFKGCAYDVVRSLLRKTIRKKQSRSRKKSSHASFPCVILFTMVIILFRLLNFPKISEISERDDFSVKFSCHPFETIYRKGQVFCEKILPGQKYLSYQPPGGGWNNQRIAFENAVIFAKLLNRTLIVHPLAPHREMLQIKELYGFLAGYRLYNKIPQSKLVPVSWVIDLKYLSHLVPVREFRKSHDTFVMQTKSLLTWRDVCHNGLLGVWIDQLPLKGDTEGWELLQKVAPPLKDVPLYRQVCTNDSETMLRKARGVKPMWGIFDELLSCDADMLYFQEGSLFIRKMLFMDKQRALEAHAWSIKYIQFPLSIWERVSQVVKAIGSPFNAVHIRRADHPSRLRVTAEYWTKRLSEMGALGVTTKLYVATDEKDKTWFWPFRELGYNLMFSDDVFPSAYTKDSSQDILGVHEQLLCAQAKFFVGSYYSTFTMYIQRLRDQASWQGGFLNNPYMTVSWVNSKET